MTEEQFEALKALMHDIAWRAAGNAIHQRRAGDGSDAENEARAAFGLPEKDD